VKILGLPGEMRAAADKARLEGLRIGLVPTMGFLHEGHLSLVRKARTLSDFLVVSVFVNPVQFGPGEDLDSYPVDAQRDEELCERQGVDIIFSPGRDRMYAENHSVCVDEEELSSGLCGAHRPGHFRGVLTVVAKLFNIVQPHVAVFGQKDAQQVRVVQRMVRDLDMSVEIVVVPTVREPDGVAMSSRNAYLSGEERRRARRVYEALCLAEKLCRDGNRDTALIKGEMTGLLAEGSPPIEIEYVETVDYETLKPVDRVERPTLVAVAARIGRARLIDNIVLGG